MPISEPSLSRRHLLGAGAALLLAGAAGPAAAQAEARAVALVESLMGELTALVASGRPEAQIYQGFERIMARYGDMPVVAASILGPPWRGASQAQKQAFVAAFQSYISRKYGRQFREYENSGLEVLSARNAGSAGVLVETRVDRPGQPPIAVAWQISERSGAPKVVNIIIEGISMLANERAEIGALLDAQGGSIDGLVAALRQRG
jgi:phospholipid transport system substrate-binding protein